MNERKLLSQLKDLNSPSSKFIININCSFQTRENLYLVMDFVNGGDLRYHIGRQQRFSEQQTKFFVACILIGLEFLHTNGIMHRDIKPENLVLDHKGYARITDLGIAKLIDNENGNGQDTSGTPGYMAPEVLCRQNHGIAVDYFALGVIAFEFMLGYRPYLGRCRKEIMDAILAKQVQVKLNQLPIGWSFESIDFINKNIDENYDYQQQISLEDTNDEIVEQTSMLLKKHTIQNVFEDYDYQYINNEIKKHQEIDSAKKDSNLLLYFQKK